MQTTISLLLCLDSNMPTKFSCQKRIIKRLLCGFTCKELKNELLPTKFDKNGGGIEDFVCI